MALEQLKFIRGNDEVGNNKKKSKKQEAAEERSNLRILDPNDENERLNTKTGKSLNIKAIVIESLFACLFSVLFTGVAAMISGVIQIPAKIDNLEKNLTNKIDGLEIRMESRMEGLETRMDDLNNRMNSLESRVNTVEGAFVQAGIYSNIFNLQPTPEGMSNLSIKYEVVNNAYLLSAPSWQKVDVIAKDAETGELYNAEDLQNEKLFLPYTDNSGQEIIFYGQFNENNQWDGNCLINIYKENCLILIMEADYDNGELLTYKQIIPFETQNETPVWSISNRKHFEKSNSGESYIYVRDCEYTKNFEITEAGLKDIIGVEEFRQSIKGNLEGYYYGNTFNGNYNDNTGNAYLIKFAENGTVRTLYKGNFKDGKFDDSTGNAWYITKDKDTQYMYYQGVFTDGNIKKPANDSFRIGLTLDDIYDIIDGETFAFELKWDF